MPDGGPAGAQTNRPVAGEPSGSTLAEMPGTAAVPDERGRRAAAGHRRVSHGTEYAPIDGVLGEAMHVDRGGAPGPGAGRGDCWPGGRVLDDSPRAGTFRLARGQARQISRGSSQSPPPKQVGRIWPGCVRYLPSGAGVWQGGSDQPADDHRSYVLVSSNLQGGARPAKRGDRRTQARDWRLQPVRGKARHTGASGERPGSPSGWGVSQTAARYQRRRGAPREGPAGVSHTMVMCCTGENRPAGQLVMLKENGHIRFWARLVSNVIT